MTEQAQNQAASIELSSRTSLNADEADTDAIGPRAQTALPPTDAGLQAYLCLGGACTSGALIWGFALSFGVLQEYYTTNEPFASRPSGIAAVGTTCTGLMYLTMPIYLAIFQRWPRWRQYALWASLPIVAIALIGASFAQTVPQLLVTQGIIYAIAGNAMVMPTINYINEWFVRKKGFAIGVAVAGDGLGGAVMPLIMQALLSRFGFRWTLRVVAAIIVPLGLPLPLLLKPRLPVSAAHIAPPVDASFLKSRVFWVFQSFNAVQALGYFLPSNYLPSIAESFGLSSTLSSLTVVVINVAMMIGSIGVGHLVDRIEVTTVLLAVSIGAAITLFAILGVTTSIAPLFVFSMLYGLTAGAYSTNWGGMIRAVQSKHEAADANLLFGLFAAGRGVGSIVSGPLSEALGRNSAVWSSAASSAYSSEYGGIIIFSGCTAAAGGLSWFAKRAGLI